MKKAHTARLLIAAFCFLPSFSWSVETPSCDEAIRLGAERAPISRVIAALKVGARDGDAFCAAHVGTLLMDEDNGREKNYSIDLPEGYRHLKQAVLNSELLSDNAKSDAFYWLGRAYFDGKPVLQNFKMAYSWFSLGASLGHPRSSAMRDRTFSLLRQAGMADGVQEFALRCKSSPKLCLLE